MRKNPKIMAFADEFGTPAHKTKPFGFGLVICSAVVAAKLDAHIVHGLPIGVGEIHSVDWANDTLVRVLEHVQSHSEAPGIALVHRIGTSKGTPEEIYAHDLIATLQTGLNRYKKLANLHTINNVELIVDRSNYNQTATFRDTILAAPVAGAMKAIEHCEVVASHAVRLIQLADIVGYATSLKNSGITQKHLEEKCGIAFA